MDPKDRDAEFFLPVPIKNLIVNLEDSKDEIIQCLDFIEKHCSNQSTKPNRGQNLMLHTLTYVNFILKNRGGKVLVFNSDVIEMELNRSLNKDEIIYSYNSSTYVGAFAKELNIQRISVSLFIQYSSYMVSH